MPFSAVDAIEPAFQHTKRQLFQPFRFGQWLRLAFVGLMAGELSSGGGCNVPSIPNLNHPRHPGAEHFLPSTLGGVDPMLYAGLIATIVIAAFVLGIVFMYISSVMRFILFDGVLAKECRIRQGWATRQEAGWRLFLFKLACAFVTLAVVIVLIGIPAGIAFVRGWLNQPKEHMVPLVLGGILLFFAFAIFILAAAVAYVLTKDFVVPQMALEGIGAVEGWRRLGTLMNAEKAGYAGYVGMKILLAIGAGIALGIVGAILALIIVIPVGVAVVAAVLAAKAAGVGWTIYTITLAVVGACVVMAIFFFISSIISVPAIVFFPAYSIYFFAARYPALSAVLYPPPPPAPQMAASYSPPPFEPPPPPPAPAPAG